MILAIGVIVAFIVMTMSRQILLDSRQDMRDFEEVKLGEQINEVHSISADGITELSHTCIEAKKASPGVAMCYAIRSKNTLPDGSSIRDAWNQKAYHGTVRVDGCSGSEKALFIDYIIPATVNITCR